MTREQALSQVAPNLSYFNDCKVPFAISECKSWINKIFDDFEAQIKAKDGHIKELEAKNAAYEAEKQQNEWKTQVSKETGVPIALLHGSTLEEMQANGKALADYIAEKTKPKVHASSESNQPPAPSGSSGDWIRDQFLEQKQK